MAEDNDLSRRDFLKATAVLAGGTALASTGAIGLVEALTPKYKEKLSDAENLSEAVDMLMELDEVHPQKIRLEVTKLLEIAESADTNVENINMFLVTAKAHKEGEQYVFTHEVRQNLRTTKLLNVIAGTEVDISKKPVAEAYPNILEYPMQSRISVRIETAEESPFISGTRIKRTRTITFDIGTIPGTDNNSEDRMFSLSTDEIYIIPEGENLPIQEIRREIEPNKVSYVFKEGTKVKRVEYNLDGEETYRQDTLDNPDVDPQAIYEEYKAEFSKPAS